MHMLEMRHISKSFAGNTVLNDISFSVQSGEVHALLGVNGAGKSTLMKILSGDYVKDRGDISINGELVDIHDPHSAKKAGIGIVVQEVDTALIPTLSVTENLILDDYVNQRRFTFNSWSARKKRAREMLAAINVEIDVTKEISECTLSEKQMILIARAVAQQAHYLILDEPTAPLSEQERQKLFHVINQLKETGVSIIYISHHLSEIKQITDRLTILRDGNVIVTEQTDNIELGDIIHHMLGNQITQLIKPIRRETSSTPLFEVNDLFIPQTGTTINLTVNEGEIVGIAGLLGAGKTEIARTLFGSTPTSSPSCTVRGKKVSISSSYEAIKAGLCLIPEERRKEGILVDSSVRENLTLPSLQTFTSQFIVNRTKEEQFSEKQINRLKIKTPNSTTQLRYLSGGNQQKVSIGKWLNETSEVYLFDEPTKGIDIGAKKDVFKLVHELANEGKGILYFTSEFEELLEIADRILVLHHGELITSFARGEATHTSLMQAASGGVIDETIS
ncbi:hypothetical protein BFG57_16150 [Bacillus solimangrovi]|uniref:Autoinducer 2 import ATP-binding protein LsrA n=1 Tax=Bacillus solimangrovi TaxID=1305675 RepID=A0A1E5LE86_9BACI|nr:hypothetical protein BFG57_16150 [Bacillus solimangrovi]